MKTVYKVKGVEQQGEEVLIKLLKHEAVSEKQSVTNILSNPLSYVDKMKLDAIKHNTVEQIRVPKDFYEEHKFKIDDLINLEVTAV